MPELLHLSFVPLSPRRARKLLIPQAQAAGLSVAHWNLGAFVGNPSGGEVESEGLCEVKTIESYASLRAELKNLGPAFINMDIGIGITTPQLSWTLRGECEKGASIMLYDFGGEVLPGPKRARSARDLLWMVRDFGVRALSFLLCRSGLFHKQRIAFAPGTASAALGAKNCTIVPVNEYSYEEYLERRGSTPPLGDRRYILFNDQALTTHPTFKNMGIQPVQHTSYIDSLNRFFDAVEKKYGLEVVIAAHPCASYDANDFQGRTIIQGQTLDLVEHCEAWLGHHSMTSSFAVMHDKPMIFLLCEAMHNCARAYASFFSVHYTQAMARYFKAPLMDVDAGYVLPENFSRDRECYKRYRYEYFTWPQIEGRSCGPDIAAFVRGQLAQRALRGHCR